MLLIGKRYPIGHRFCYLSVVVIARYEAIQAIKLSFWIAALRSHFQRVFKQETGLSPADFVAGRKG